MPDKQSHQVDHTHRLPSPGIRWQISPRSNLLTTFCATLQPTLALNCPLGDNFNKVPFPFLCKPFCEPTRRIAFPGIQLERLLKTLRGTVGIGR